MPPRVLELCVEFRNHIWNARARISVEDWATANRCAEFVTVASTDLQKALTMKIPLPRPRPPLRDTVGENPVVPISAFRQQHGEGPVAISGMLTRIAQEQANAMAARDLLDHVLLAPFAHRMGRSRFKRGAENIAFGHADFTGTLKQWINSSGHRQSVAARCKVDRRCPRLKCPSNLLGNGDRRRLTYSEILEFTNVRLYPLRHS